MTLKNPLFLFLSAVAAGLLISCSGEKSGDESADSGGNDAEILFNGKDLTGWKGNPANWTVENGVIVGTTSEENPLPYNQFLIWEGKPVEDFELTAELRLTSNGNNSGIQYRSKLRPDLGEYVVSGYQCDMHPFVWANGMLYDEKERGILCKRGQMAVATPDGKALVVGDLGEEPVFDTTQWSTYRIIAKGNHLVHEVNGTKTVDIYDHDEKERDLDGVIAFQIHRGPAMKVEIRNVTLKRLETSGITPPEETPIPKDAPEVNPPKPAAKGKGKEPKKATEKGKGKEAVEIQKKK